MNTIISVEDVTFLYGTTVIIDGIYFTIKEGEYIGIVGENGSGKSTLIKLLLGVLKPQTGTIRLFGTAIEDFNQWYRIGYVPQTMGEAIRSIPITVDEVMKTAFNKECGESFVEQKQYVYDLMGIRDLSNHLVSKLSGGQFQRVMIARSLINKPSVLILDEPTNGVDSENRLILYEFLTELKRDRSLTILHITHDIDSIKHVTSGIDRVLCIEKTLLCDMHDDREHIHA